MKKIPFVLIICALMFLLTSSVSAELKTGDVFVMGQFEQDDSTRNGDEPIEWLVLAAEDDKALIISRYSLAAKMFHYPKTETPWENSNMRKWLNDDFLNSAFDPDEQKRIIPARISTPDNPVYQTDGGNDTEDRLFLLSLDEAETYFASDEDRLVQTTEYSKKHGAFIRGNGMSEWWLRSPGKPGGYAAIVSSLGKVNKDGNSLNNVSCTVRPAFWLALADDYEPPAPAAEPEPILLTGTIDLSELSQAAPEKDVPEILSLDEAEEMGLTIPVPAEGEFIYLGEAKSDQAERMLAVFTMDPAVPELRNVNILIYKAAFESGGVKADDLTLSVKTESSYPVTDGLADGGSFTFRDVDFTDWGALAQFSFTLNLPKPAGFSFTFDPVDMTIVRQGGLAAYEAAAAMTEVPEEQASGGDPFVTDIYEQDGKMSSGPEPAEEETDDDLSETEPMPEEDAVEIPEDLEAGDVFSFGRYEQDDDPDDGTERIEWLTLAVEKERALVVSLNILDSLPYHAKGGAVNWQNSSLREWLNGEFFEQAFNQAEKDRIRESKISDPGNELFGTKKSPDTKDRVFLLGIDEAEKYFGSDEERNCEATDYAKAAGIFVDQEDWRSWWWLRTAGKSESDAAYVGVVGWIMERGNFVENPYVGVRPAMWLWLSDEAAAEGDNDFRTVNQPGDVGVLLRKTPSFSGDILRSLMNGSEVLPLGDSRMSEGRNWIHIQTKEGLEGWIPETALGD